MAGLSRALIAAAVFATDPAGTGLVLRAPATAARQRLLEQLRACLPDAAPWLRVPLHVSADRLLGGLDLAASLGRGRPVLEAGILERAHGGVLVVAMAERVTVATAAPIAHVLDCGEIALEREGFSVRRPSRCGVLALDEGCDPDERVPLMLAERLAMHVALEPARPGEVQDLPWTRATIARARARLPRVRADDAALEALCATAVALGIGSLRAPIQALHVARVLAALGGRLGVATQELETAAALVLAPRARQVPANPADPQTAEEPPPPEPPRDAQTPPEPPPSDPPADPPGDTNDSPPEDAPETRPLEELVLAAARAALPPALLDPALAAPAGRTARRDGSAGAQSEGRQRGRPVGTRAGEPRGGARLDLMATLRAAAPWQRLRGARGRLAVRRADLRIRRFRTPTASTTVFVVDASGSAALQRLAETKGAVELLLADCYVRRDQVALIAFRGPGAELLLPPTRSLTRVKRSLAALPGGGGTPLAHAIDAAVDLAGKIRRHGETPVLVLLTDGRANIARDGSGGRERAAQDALAAARRLGALGVYVLCVDTSPQPQARMAEIAAACRGRYLALPYAEAVALKRHVAAAVDAAREA